MTNHIIIIPSSAIYIERLWTRTYGNLASCFKTVSKSCLTQNRGGEELQFLFMERNFPPARTVIYCFSWKLRLELLKKYYFQEPDLPSEWLSEGIGEPEEKIEEVLNYKDCQWWLMVAETYSVTRPANTRIYTSNNTESHERWTGLLYEWNRCSTYLLIMCSVNNSEAL